MKDLLNTMENLRREIKKLPDFAFGNILFGHKSVGLNIMNGINSLNLEILSNGLIITDDVSMFDSKSNVFYHYKNGENKKPFGKIDSFEAELVKYNQYLQIAFFKFCYADIIYSTDVNKLFCYYKERMAKIQKEYPETQIIHFTVPLNTKPKGLKGAVRSIIKWDSNRKREEFNNLIRNEYPERLIFDLARYESEYSEGNREKSITRVPALRPDLTSDGGHLNKIGQEYVGALLLLKIASITRNN